VDEKVLEEIQFHQETLSRDSNSPLHLIREKEMSISGRVLAAKQEAEEIVAAARKDAAGIIVKAEEESKDLAKQREKSVLKELEGETAQISIDADAEIEALKSAVKERIDSAASLVCRRIAEV